MEEGFKFTCKECNGSGNVGKIICPNCFGSGDLDWVENVVGKKNIISVDHTTHSMSINGKEQYTMQELYYHIKNKWAEEIVNEIDKEILSVLNQPREISKPSKPENIIVDVKKRKI
ncbi:MAG: hypothetical protein PVG65_04195 [Candidatus Thorarchaeota archaeon]|jgi:DnaJ-class molecular chaperone